MVLAAHPGREPDWFCLYHCQLAYSCHADRRFCFPGSAVGDGDAGIAGAIREETDCLKDVKCKWKQSPETLLWTLLFNPIPSFLASSSLEGSVSSVG